MQHGLVLVADAHDLFQLSDLFFVIDQIALAAFAFGGLKAVCYMGQPVQQALLIDITLKKLAQRFFPSIRRSIGGEEGFDPFFQIVVGRIRRHVHDLGAMAKGKVQSSLNSSASSPTRSLSGS